MNWFEFTRFNRLVYVYFVHAYNFCESIFNIRSFIEYLRAYKLYNQTSVYIGTANNRMQIPSGQHVREGARPATASALENFYTSIVGIEPHRAVLALSEFRIVNYDE